MKSKCFKKLIKWLVANGFLPILIPVLCLCIPCLFKSNCFPFVSNFEKLFFNGFYIFSAMSLVLSLLEDYEVLNFCTKTWENIVMVLLVLSLCYVFCLNEQDGRENYIPQHMWVYIIVWVANVVIASILKCKILLYHSKTETN